jgi:hypothetical protein
MQMSSLYSCNDCGVTFCHDEGEFSIADAIVAYTRSDAQAYPPARPFSSGAGVPNDAHREQAAAEVLASR